MPVTLLDQQGVEVQYPEGSVRVMFTLNSAGYATVTMSSPLAFKTTINDGDPTRIWIDVSGKPFQVAVRDGDTMHIRLPNQPDVVMEMDWERARRVTVHIEKGPGIGYRRVE